MIFSKKIILFDCSHAIYFDVCKCACQFVLRGALAVYI